MIFLKNNIFVIKNYFSPIIWSVLETKLGVEVLRLQRYVTLISLLGWNVEILGGYFPSVGFTWGSLEGLAYPAGEVKVV